jgi:hypothetical protein
MTHIKYEDLKLALEALESTRIIDFSVEDIVSWKKAITAFKQALAAPTVQEPCGWQFYQDGKWHNGMEINNHRANTEAAGVPVRDVYPTPPAAQPAPVPLTYEQITAISKQVAESGPEDSIDRFARAIEAAHGIKENT